MGIVAEQNPVATQAMEFSSAATVEPHVQRSFSHVSLTPQQIEFGPHAVETHTH